MTIGIAGAGGIGSYYAGLLSRAGNDVHLLARGNHLAAVAARGLEVRMPDESFVATPDVSADPAVLVGCDYVLVAVKGYSLGEIAPALAAAANSGAVIVPLLNGVDVAERLAALGVPITSIVGGLVAASLVRSAPGVVERRSPFDRAVMGELDGAATLRTARIVDLLAAAGVSARASDDIALDLWRKFAFIVPMTVVCGVTRKPVGEALAKESGREMVVGSLREIVQVSRRGPTSLDDADEERVRADLFALPAGMRPSFLQDLERGGPTEVDLLAGTVCRLGRERGVPTPIHDGAVAAFQSV